MNYLVIRWALTLFTLSGLVKGTSPVKVIVTSLEARGHQQADVLGVTIRRLNIRSRPAINGQWVKTTKVGDTLVILSRRVQNDYLRVATSEGDTGWVSRRSVKFLSSIDHADSQSTPARASASLSVAAGDISTWEKPEPVEQQGGACVAEGLGKNGKAAPDPATDLRKNRIDTSSSYHSVSFDQVLALPWSGLPRRRAGWNQSDSLQIVALEGPPVMLEGYLVDVVEEGAESTNCELNTHEWHDWHMWLVPTSGEAANRDRARAVVVEVTPRVRATSPNWILTSVKALARNGDKVRISGWLMWDPDHPDQVGKTRGTTWEIHPVTKIEVDRNGDWQNVANQ